MVRITAIFWLLMFLGLHWAWCGTIYFYQDSKGGLHFTDLPDSDRYRPYFGWGRAAQDEQKKILAWARIYSQEFALDFSLVRAVIEAESGYAVRACSSKGAKGLMQIMPETGQDLGLAEPYDPESNIKAGVHYLKSLLNRFKRVDLALAAYNAGPSRVEEYKGIPPFGETKTYVRKVLALYERYKADD